MCYFTNVLPISCVHVRQTNCFTTLHGEIASIRCLEICSGLLMFTVLIEFTWAWMLRWEVALVCHSFKTPALLIIYMAIMLYSIYLYLCILQYIVWYLHDEQGREKLWDGDKCSWRVRHLLMLFAWGFNTKYSLHTNVWEKSLHFKSPLLRPQRPLQMTRFNAKCRPAWMIIYFLYLFVLRRNN